MENEILAKISKGTKMDQIYLPKLRSGFQAGEFVIIKPVFGLKQGDKNIKKPFFYNIKEIEPIKLKIIQEIFEIIESSICGYENIIITGSFLEKGFDFRDIDIIILYSKKINLDRIIEEIQKKIGINPDIISIDNKSFAHGLKTDPLYQMMLSKCISKKRFLYKQNNEIKGKILDLHLLKSKILIDNFDLLSGREKYALVRNLISIKLFIENKKIDKENMEREIEKCFKVSAKAIKENALNKTEFIHKYSRIYKNVFERIIEFLKTKNGAKQE